MRIIGQYMNEQIIQTSFVNYIKIWFVYKLGTTLSWFFFSELVKFLSVLSHKAIIWLYETWNTVQELYGPIKFVYTFMAFWSLTVPLLIFFHYIEKIAKDSLYKYTFWVHEADMRWVNNDRIFISGWNIP